ncbi:hypothetical protein HYPSUDRAFT_39410 [Hypholoma sublateritium FD-334 SS-4]|uniref:Uncharacterized protein n=1 Tax=Hypholoma sublateritium (strain FD-334 SS-4) TaxID=945553 RepID=A0A0D2NYT5_HYPSF|nr:hypothetical protein HYPSUDRAFT_39410 [Hypholoma sublateritium FD-334 SS-4]
MRLFRCDASAGDAMCKTVDFRRSVGILLKFDAASLTGSGRLLGFDCYAGQRSFPSFVGTVLDLGDVVVVVGFITGKHRRNAAEVLQGGHQLVDDDYWTSQRHTAALPIFFRFLELSAAVLAIAFSILRA